MVLGLKGTSILKGCVVWRQISVASKQQSREIAADVAYASLTLTSSQFVYF